MGSAEERGRKYFARLYAAVEEELKMQISTRPKFEIAILEI